MKKFFPVICSAILILTSCSKDLTPTLILSKKLFSLPSAGGTVEFTMTVDMKWHIEPKNKEDIIEFVLFDEAGKASNPALTLDGEAGTFTVAATLSATKAMLTENHIVSITAYGEVNNTLKDVIITQEPHPTILLSYNEITVPKEGGVLKLALSSNQTWTASCDTEGVSLFPVTKPAGNHTVEITIPKNLEDGHKVIVASFSIGESSEKLTITQL